MGRPMSSEDTLLESARRGDESAFGALLEPYRRQLLAHCYRMLGSYQDAEDALQDTMLNAWRALPRFERRSSVRSWLYTIATNSCLKALERRRTRLLPVDFAPAADPHDEVSPPIAETTWLEPFPGAAAEADERFLSPDARYEQRESVELAFVAALQHLPAKQRAVLILRDVLGFSAREVGEIIEISPAAVDSSLQRAHRTVDDRLPDRSQQTTLRTLGDERVREIVARFITAWESADVAAVVSLLAEDATFAMPPQSNWFRGRDAIAAFFAARPLGSGLRWRMQPIEANGQTALAQYVWSEPDGSFVAEAITLLSIDDGAISEITAFRTPRMFAGFGLPVALGGA
jgi:RNA polymerase sigma-70 factor (ECF subfamily)